MSTLDDLTEPRWKTYRSLSLDPTQSRDALATALENASHDVERLEVALRELIEDYEASDAYPTSDGHPLYAAREALTGSRSSLASRGESDG